MKSPSTLCLAALLSVLAWADCKKRIGDSCNTNADCSALGDRFCDTSAPCGSCTVESCDVRADQNGNLIDSCPGEAMCVRFFESVRSPQKECNPDPNAGVVKGCALNERCLCDLGSPYATDPAHHTALECNRDATGTSAPAHCAPESTERRWCELICNKESDCRVPEGFHCVSLGQFGSLPVPRSLQFVTTDSGATESVPVGTDPDPNVNSSLPTQFCLCTDPSLCYPTNTTCGTPRFVGAGGGH